MALARPALGAPAPPIDLPTIDGSNWSLAAHRGKPVVLVFHRHIH